MVESETQPRTPDEENDKRKGDFEVAYNRMPEPAQDWVTSFNSIILEPDVYADIRQDPHTQKDVAQELRKLGVTPEDIEKTFSYWGFPEENIPVKKDER